ncbi:MAG: dockerin type I repeat-containing protein [Planctomycetota bacterium]
MRLHVLVFVLTLFVIVTPEAARGQTQLKVIGTSVAGLVSGQVEVRLTTNAPVRAFTLAISYNSTELAVDAIQAAGAALGAEQSVGSIYDATGGVTLGVVLDAVAPFAGQTIAPGIDLLVATFTATPLVAVTFATSQPLTFVDAAFGDPPVVNTVTTSTGAVIDAAQGLTFVAGVFVSSPAPPNLLYMQPTTIGSFNFAAVPILLSNLARPVEGFVIAITHDPLALELEDILINDTDTDAAGAELVLKSIAPVGGSGGTLAVVLDQFAPYAGQVIPPGPSHHIASFLYTAVLDLVAGVDTSVTRTLTFADGVLGSPPVENLLMINGVMTQPDLEVGIVTIEPRAPSTVSFYCGALELAVDGSGEPIDQAHEVKRGGTTELCFFYTSEQNIQGFQLAVCFDCELIVESFSIEGTIVEAVGAEFVNYQIDNTPFDGDGCELVAGILLDALPPFAGQTVPPSATPLAFACITVSVTDTPICTPQAPAPPLGINFYAGLEGLTLDAAGEPLGGPIQAAPGSTFELCFFYTSPAMAIQGVQIAVCFDCDLEFGTFTIDGTAAGAVGAEYVNFQVDNDPNDGDGCELLAGVLLDLFPPFLGQTLLYTTTPLTLGCIDVTVAADAPCEALLNIEFCDQINGLGSVLIENIAVVDYQSIQNIGKHCTAVLVCPTPGAECEELCVQFCDPINGTGLVPIENIVVIDFQSIQNITKYGCCLRLFREVTFVRGDCNEDDKLDLADAALVLGQQFFGQVVTCEDACDINNDGLINLADSVYILDHLFKQGSPPVAPFPECGPDPDEDLLDCEGYSHCDACP